MTTNSCTTQPMSSVVMLKQPLPYQQHLDRRTMDSVDLIVIHSTELPTLAMARAYGEKILYVSGTGNSGHYYVDRDGKIYQYVNDDHIANHVRGYNPRSIGIEIVNNGRYPNWFDANAQTVSEPFSSEQIRSTIALIQHLSDLYPAIQTIAGHAELDLEMIAAQDDPSQQIRRKIDPGPLFPWSELMSQIRLKRGLM